jgi:hypothetical protein
LSTVPTAKNIQSPLSSPLSLGGSVGECDQYLCRNRHQPVARKATVCFCFCYGLGEFLFPTVVVCCKRMRSLSCWWFFSEPKRQVGVRWCRELEWIGVVCMRYAMRTLYTDSNLFASPSAVELRWLFVRFKIRFFKTCMYSRSFECQHCRFACNLERG